MGRKPTKKTTPKGINIGAKGVYISFQYKNQQCRERVPQTTTDSQSVKYAVRYKAEIEAKIERGDFCYADSFPNSHTKHAKRHGVLTSKYTVNDLFIRCGDYTSIVESPTTAVKYKISSKHTRKVLGHHLATDLSEVHIRDWIKSQKHLTRKTISNYLIPLRIALAMGKDDGILNVNVANLVSVGKTSRGLINPEQRRKKTKVNPFNISEITAIIQAAGEYNETAQNLIETAMFTGLRISELCGLKWVDEFKNEIIDFEHEKLRVVNALVFINGQYFWKGTKTQTGLRTIDLTPKAYTALKRQQKLTRFGGGCVFTRFDKGTYKSGSHLTHADQYYKPWMEILEMANVEYRPMKETRHTFASQMLLGKETPLYVANQLGHADVITTYKHYARFIENSNEKKVYKSSFGQLD